MHINLTARVHVELSCVVDSGTECEAYPGVYDARRAALEAGIDPNDRVMTWAVYYSPQEKPYACSVFASTPFSANEDGIDERQAAIDFITRTLGEDAALRFSGENWPDTDVPASRYPKPPTLPYGYDRWELTDAPGGCGYVRVSYLTYEGQTAWLGSVEGAAFRAHEDTKGVSYIRATSLEEQ